MKKNYWILSAAIAAMTLCACAGGSDRAAEAGAVDVATQEALAEWKNDHFGLFVHFGVYSQLGGVWKGEKVPFYGEQIMNHARIPIDEYEAEARRFNPTEFDAADIVTLAKNAGMKYIVITTKHHDGFCLFDTKTTDYDVVDYSAYGKDIVAQLAEECRRQGVKIGFYYSLPDWHYPQGIPRLSPDTTTKCWEYVNQVYSPLEMVTPELEDYIVEQVTELLTNYGEVVTMWFDMGLITPEQSRRIRETVKSLQPGCIINGRIMNNMGDYMTLPDNGEVASYGDIYWDNPASLYGTWGYKSYIDRPPLDVQIQTQIDRLTSTVRHGGVFLLNIGPDGMGRVIDYERRVLEGIGEFLRANPDTLDVLSGNPGPTRQVRAVSGKNGEVVLTPENGMSHAALDGKGYMSIQPHSSMCWTVSLEADGAYDVFVVYSPQNVAKEYVVRCDGRYLKQTLPGVDRMVQTCYMGQMSLTKGTHEVVLDLAERCSPLEALGLDLVRIVLRKR